MILRPGRTDGRTAVAEFGGRALLVGVLTFRTILAPSVPASPEDTPEHEEQTHPAPHTGWRLKPVAGNEGSGLAYLDASGCPRLLLGTTVHGLGLSVYDDAGVPRGLMGFKGGGIGFKLWSSRAVQRADVTLKLTAASFGVCTNRGTLRSALVLAWSRSAAAFFGRGGELRAAAALGEYFPVLARFDTRGRLIREPLHHVLPGLFVEAVKASVGFVTQAARTAGAPADGHPGA